MSESIAAMDLEEYMRRMRREERLGECWLSTRVETKRVGGWEWSRSDAIDIVYPDTTYTSKPILELLLDEKDSLDRIIIQDQSFKTTLVLSSSISLLYIL